MLSPLTSALPTDQRACHSRGKCPAQASALPAKIQPLGVGVWQSSEATTWDSCILYRMPGLNPGSTANSSVLLMWHPRRQEVPATHTGDLDGVSGSWLWSGPDVAHVFSRQKHVSLFHT